MPNESQPLMLERNLVVKQAAIVVGKRKSPAGPCVLSVSVVGGKQQYVVCSLHEGAREHCALELPLSTSDNAILHLTGPHKVHLTGYLDVEEEDNVTERDDETAAAPAPPPEAAAPKRGRDAEPAAAAPRAKKKTRS